MEGNVSFYRVNLVSRITGEGGGRSFEGRGGLVLIKSERVCMYERTLTIAALGLNRETIPNAIVDSSIDHT